MIHSCNSVNPICPDSLAIRPFRFTASLLQGESGLSSTATMRKTASDRFWEKVNKNGKQMPHVPELGNCWEWTAVKFANGYGTFSKEGKTVKAHRFSYELHFGAIGLGKDVCHKCDNKPCVRPDHLFEGTRSENLKDCVAKGRWDNQQSVKTHCPKGHPYSGDNLRIAKHKDGSTERVCRECCKLWARSKRASLDELKEIK